MNTSANNTRPIGIVGAMKPEVDLLINDLEAPNEAIIAGIRFVSGTLCGKPVVIMQCGIGKVNAAIGTTLLIAHYAVSAVINTGVAGGLGKTLSIGDIVIGETIVHHDVDVTAFGHDIGQIPDLPAAYPCNPFFIKAMEKASKTLTAVKTHKGQIVSGDVFVNQSSVFEQIKSHFPEALAVEMEAAAIAQTCYRFETPVVIIRAISDLADQQASTSFETFLHVAAKRSANLISTLLDTIKR